MVTAYWLQLKLSHNDLRVFPLHRDKLQCAIPHDWSAKPSIYLLDDVDTRHYCTGYVEISIGMLYYLRQSVSHGWPWHLSAVDIFLLCTFEVNAQISAAWTPYTDLGAHASVLISAWKKMIWCHFAKWNVVNESNEIRSRLTNILIIACSTQMRVGRSLKSAVEMAGNGSEKPRFLGLKKNLRNLKSPKFRFFSFFNFLVKF